MSNKMALDALTAALAAMEHMGNVLNNMDAVDEEEDAQHDAAFEAVRAAIAALQAEPQPEPVAQIVGTGGTANMPLLQWLSADHSFRAPIGSMLYALPAAPPKD